ncbi:DUF4365 domain-containing protein [Pedobacter cryoconitis]|uniref:DUF4365 domain-containing protein n=1 Tax=Pedobacter cryoconitis TaxID=188932 RepID=UPI001621BDC0|nr:DUF4365 domain-containing protein [Pedobacter cryoconitis]MBB5645911.1 hypothetical protein [Pedobacter cryoconitis]
MDYRSTLPKSSSNESLETISRNKLALLFHNSLFEIRHELVRDKGVDLIVEIKENDYYTNFRFIIQLKATGHIKANTDLSLSFGIEVNNINYLLNYGMPAYYILYDQREDRFLFANAKEIYQSMIKKYQNSPLPRKYTFHFSKNLDELAIHSIYEDTLHNGLLLRRLNSHIKNTAAGKQLGAGIMIDEDNEVYSVEQNLSFIENCGFRLLNDFEFQRIIEIEQRTYLGGREMSPIFNYVCGMAYFHKAQIYKAIDYLKKADRKSSSFEPDQKAILNYILLQAKYLLGILNEETYDSENKKLLEGKDLGSFLEIEKACQLFYDEEGTSTQRIKTLYKNITNIIEREPDNIQARIVGYSKILSIELIILTHDFTKNLTNLFWFGGSYLKDRLYEKWEIIQQKYFERITKVIEIAANLNYVLALSNLAMDHLSWLYRSAYIREFFDNWNADLCCAGKIKDKTAGDGLLKKTVILDKVCGYCENISHPETQVLCLFLKYKIEDFTCHSDASITTLSLIYNLIQEKELQHSHLENYEKLVKGETDHEVFYKNMESRMINFHKIIADANINLNHINNPPVDSLESFDEYIEWSITDFLEFDFTDIINEDE